MATTIYRGSGWSADAVGEIRDGTVYRGTGWSADAIGEYKLSWKWEFEGDNRADTLLGNLAAGSAALDAAEYSTQIAFTLNATVTQID